MSRHGGDGPAIAVLLLVIALWAAWVGFLVWAGYSLVTWVTAQ